MELRKSTDNNSIHIALSVLALLTSLGLVVLLPFIVLVLRLVEIFGDRTHIFFLKYIHLLETAGLRAALTKIKSDRTRCFSQDLPQLPLFQ